MSPSDHQELLGRVAQGDSTAFRALYDALGSRVYNTALGFTKHPQEAEDIAQEVFVKVFRSAGKFNGQSAVMTWVYRITVNTALSHLERRQKRAGIGVHEDAPDPPDFDHPGVLLENKELARYLFRVIDTLSDNQKTAFILSYVEELSRQEVADIMELSLKAVESLLMRAKKNLRKKLKHLDPNRRK